MSIKLSDWKALDDIQTAIESYRSGEATDYDTLILIRDILSSFGFSEFDSEKNTEIDCKHESDGQKWKKFFMDDKESWLLCKKCEQFYK